MMRAGFLLVTVAMFGGGCGMFAKMQQSVFFSKFRLDKSVDATAYKGIAKPGDAGPGGGIGGGTGYTSGGIGAGGMDVKSSSTSSTSFAIIEEGDNKFEEREFIEALSSRIKKEIEESRASITGGGNPASNEFYVDYKDGGFKGRITVSGDARGSGYVLKATIDESNKP